jgi:hypothetical protein
VNVPFCVAGFILAWRMLDPDATSARPRVDIAGWLLLSPGLVAILLGLSNSSQEGGFGRADALGPLLAGAVLLVTFALYSVRRAGNALVDVRLFAHRPLASASALTFLSGAALYGGMVLLPLYWQDVRGADALRAGLLLAPQGIGALLSRPLAGGLSDRIGARWVAFTGFAIVGLATAAGRRVIRCRCARRHPRCRSPQPRHASGFGGAGRDRLRPGILVGGRLHRTRPRAEPDAARPHPAPGTELRPRLAVIGAGAGASIGQLSRFILTSANMDEVGSASVSWKPYDNSRPHPESRSVAPSSSRPSTTISRIRVIVCSHLTLR